MYSGLSRLELHEADRIWLQQSLELDLFIFTAVHLAVYRLGFVRLPPPPGVLQQRLAVHVSCTVAPPRVA